MTRPIVNAQKWSDKPKEPLMSLCLTAYLLDLEKLESVLGAGADVPELRKQIRQYADNQQRVFAGEDFAASVERGASQLLAGQFVDAARERLILEGFEAICATIGEPLDVGPFAGCHFELFEECGQTGSYLLVRGCPISRVASASVIYHQMGYIRRSEMPKLLAEVTAFIDEAPDPVATDVMEAWEVLEEGLSKAIDQNRDIISFQH